MKNTTATLGVILGNRDFFPDKLVGEARADLTRLFAEMGITPVWLSPEETKLGGVETHDDARRCAELFRRHRDQITGVLVCLPNFGDEKGVADTLKLAGLNVPVLVQGYPDDLDKLDVIRRRDAFCGKISVCNNLRQAGIAFTLTTNHVVHPLDASFRADLQRFVGKKIAVAKDDTEGGSGVLHEISERVGPIFTYYVKMSQVNRRIGTKARSRRDTVRGFREQR
jgi:L-fucose isomerase-like protein